MLRGAWLIICLALPAVADAAWRVADTRHFVIYSEQDAASLRTFADRLERYDQAMRLLRGLGDPEISPANRLTIYVVPDVQAVRKLVESGRRGLAGFYIPRAAGSIAIVPRRMFASGNYDLSVQNVLLHEYAHHFLYRNFTAAYPSWFIEGFAEFHATAKLAHDGAVEIGAAPLYRAYGLATVSLPIEKLLSLGAGDLSDPQWDALYGRGWLLMHYLSFEPSRKGQLGAYLTALNGGKASLEAATAVFGELRQLERELAAYLRQRRLRGLRIDGAVLKVAPATVRDLDAGEAAMMDVRIRSKRGMDEESAKALVPVARAAAAEFPSHAPAQTMLAEVELDAHNFAEGEAAADRALRADAESVDALICKGRATMALASKAGTQDPTVWQEARRWLVAANRLDPRNPKPLQLFYTSFHAAGSPPTANAVAGLISAFSFAPEDRNLRLMVAHQYLVDGKAAEARKALAPIAFDPHAGHMAAAVAPIIEAIDRGDTVGALTAWRSLGEAARSRQDR